MTDSFHDALEMGDCRDTDPGKASETISLCAVMAPNYTANGEG